MGRKLAVRPFFVLLILWTGVIGSCSFAKKEIEEKIILADKEISEFNDSLFPYQIESILKYKDKYLLCEFGSDRVSLLDLDLNKVSVVANTGHGPGEVMAPLNIAIWGDSLFVFDDTKWSFEILNLKTGIGRSYKPLIERGIFEKFSVVDGKIYFSNGIYPITIIDIYDNKISNSKEYYEVDYLNDREKRNRNAKHILAYKDGLISVAATEPVFEYLNLNGDVLKRVKLEGIHSIKTRLDFVKSEYLSNPENRESTYYLFDDATIFNNKLYTLIYYNDPITGEVKNNKVLVFEITGDDFLFKEELTLQNSYGGDFFGSICIAEGGKLLISYEAISSSINIFDLNKP